MSGQATRLYPLPPREIPAQAIYEDLELPPRGWRHASRPYVMMNMVASVDGRIAVGGKAAPLGSGNDRQTMRNLRSRAGAVMIGAGTLRAERLSLSLDGPTPEPPTAVIVTQKESSPPIENLVVDPRQRIVVITSEEAPRGMLDGFPGGTIELRVPVGPSGAADLGEALKVLKGRFGVEILLAEGGPTLNHYLISHQLADELFLTLSPKLVSGLEEETLTIVQGPRPFQDPLDLNLLSTHLAGDELYLRYGLHRT